MRVLLCILALRTRLNRERSPLIRDIEFFLRSGGGDCAPFYRLTYCNIAHRSGRSCFTLQKAVHKAPAEEIIDPSIQKYSPGIRRIAVLGNHAPRQCGIATFTTDLNEAISAQFPGIDCFVMAMNDGGRHYAYPAPVQF